MTAGFRLFVTAIIGALLMPFASAQQPALQEWSQWRGANRDGISQETGLLQEWPKSGPPLVWRVNGIGNGYSSFSTSGGRLYTLGARGGIEYVIALDRATGKKVWETQNGRRYENDRGDGPRSTPTVEGDRLYVLGGSGDLTCLENATGKKIWSINIVQQFSGVNPYWGYSESPLIVGDRILINTGGRAAGIAAVSKADGSTLWRQHNDGAGYSSPVLMRTGSLSQVIFFTEQRTMAVDPRDGRLLWSYNKANNGTANIATPIVRGTKVFVSSDYGTGGALLDVRAAGNIATANEVYFTRDMRNHHASSVLVGDHLYGFSSSILTALMFETGKTVWRDRSVGKGSLIFADGRLYLYSEDGVVGLAEASPTAYREHGRFTLSPQSGLPTWSHPIIAGGLLVIRDQETVYAYDVKRR
ncbi:MAG TPA: PQQ-binding-like beta-propeller repeat protein [Vicinamibacterales bacterium]|nr:PQQ-binding-like beta-propeller repeat protein [Vicinamibacterales bacterium]